MQLTIKEKQELEFLIGQIYAGVDTRAVSYLGAFTKEEKDVTSNLRENLKELKDFLGLTK